MNVKRTMKIASTFLVIALSLISCKKEKEAECYDAALKQHFQKISCTQDCPGVMGCDGNQYCNECIANSNGIRVQ
jgi:hypothetical protein